MRHRLKAWRRRVLRAARRHNMLAVTAVVLAAAGAGAGGAFDADGRPAARVESTTAPASTPAAASTAVRVPMTITYVLVGSEEERYAWDSYEDSMKQRGFLSRYAVEVLVVATPEQAMAASRLIEEQRARNPWNTYVVDDRR